MVDFTASAEQTYWNQFYGHASVTEEPSTFAKHALPYINKSSTLVELGCGNGRDSLFFSSNGINVIALDLSEKAIELNKMRGLPNVNFINCDFTNPPATVTSDENIGNIYSRFTLHSVDKAGFDRTIRWVANTLKKGGRFFIEARTINDALYGVGTPMDDDGFETTHYRRFLNPRTVKEQLESHNFNFLYFVEDYLSAVYNNDGAVVLRIICEKQ